MAAYAPSFFPITIGVLPSLSLAAIMPSSVSSSIEQEPLTVLNTFSMPSTKSFPCIIRSAISSVWLVSPELSSAKCMFFDRRSSTISFMFTTLATVTMANFPRCELITIGWGSVSLMTPIPDVPLLNLSSSSSNLLLKYALCRLCMDLWNPSSLL